MLPSGPANDQAAGARPDLEAGAVNPSSNGNSNSKDVFSNSSEGLRHRSAKPVEPAPITSMPSIGPLWQSASQLHAAAVDEQQQIKQSDSKRRVLKRKVTTALNGMPTLLALLVMFPLLVGLMMSFVVPLFLEFRDRGKAVNTATFQGWIGCRPTAPANADPRAAVPKPRLARYMPLPADNFNDEHEEQPYILDSSKGLQDGYLPLCPPDPNLDWQKGLERSLTSEDKPYASDQPFVKLIFVISNIIPEEVQATVNIRLVVVNGFDQEDTLVRQNAGTVFLNFTPKLPAGTDIQLNWQDQEQAWTVTQVVLESVSPITNYPYDLYRFGHDMSALITLFNETNYPQTRGLPVQIWFATSTQLFRLEFQTPLPGDPGNPNRTMFTGVRVNIRRTNFTKAYAIIACIMMWFLGGFNLLHCLDNIFVRPRPLSDAFAPALLFALPSFRSTMPGVPEAMGLAIDMMGLVWAELMVAICVIISFIAFLGQYKHPAPLFKRIHCEESEPCGRRENRNEGGYSLNKMLEDFEDEGERIGGDNDRPGH